MIYFWRGGDSMVFVYDVLGIDKDEFIKKYSKYEDEILEIIFGDMRGRAEVGERLAKYLCSGDDIDRVIKAIAILTIIHSMCGALVGDARFFARATYYAMKACKIQGIL